MKRIFIDTAPLIYITENSGVLFSKTYTQLQNWIQNDNSLFSSVLTLTELLIHPIKTNNVALENSYTYLLKSILSEPLIAIDEQISVKAAFYRAKYNIRTPDALQIAAAVTHACDIFFTNDKKLKKISDIKVLTL